MEAKEKNIKRGKKSRASGADFERRVRKDLEEKGWIVDKWTNSVEFKEENSKEVYGYHNGEDWVYGKLLPAKRKYAGLGRPMAIGTGFPDFIAFGLFEDIPNLDSMIYKPYKIIGVEAKINGYLDKEEREKCKWLLENKIFSKILIASKTKIKNRVVIKYEDFSEKYKER